MTDWERTFEEELIPLVSSASTPAALDACITVVINSVVPGSAANKQQFRQLFDSYTRRSPDFTARLSNAVAFMRLVKQARLEAAGVVAAPTASSIPRARRVSEPDAQTVLAENGVTRSASMDHEAIEPEAAPVQEKEPPRPMSFEAVFDEALSDYLRQVLALLEAPDVTAPGYPPVPFLMTTGVADALIAQLREHVFPVVRSSRAISARLRDVHQWNSDSHSKVIEMLTAGETNNPILVGWDTRLEELSAASKASEPAVKAFWRGLAPHAKQNHCPAPGPQDLGALRSLLHYNLPMLEKAWKELVQCYQQEFNPGKHQAAGREGLLRDCMIRWDSGSALPPYCGEWLCIRIALINTRKMGFGWLDRYSKNKGRNQAERLRRVPYLMWYLSHPTPPEPPEDVLDF